MKTPLLVVAVCSGLPGCAMQDPVTPASPDTAVFAAACTAEDDSQDHLKRASSALPARASTRPEPQLGTVAPNTRVPSHVVTPSMRAMERATAARESQESGIEKRHGEKISPPCAQRTAPDPAAPTGMRKG